MYGGRVIDDFDRRVVKTYMDEYMGDFIFDTFQPFHFYKNEEVDYFIPKPEKGVYSVWQSSLAWPSKLTDCFQTFFAEWIFEQNSSKCLVLHETSVICIGFLDKEVRKRWVIRRA